MWIKQTEKILYLEDSCGYDVIIKCFDTDIFTHRLILAAVSSWFREIITVSDTDEIIQTIMMKDFLSSDILTLLDFVSGKFDIFESNDLIYDLHIDLMSSFSTNQVFTTNYVESVVDTKVEAMDSNKNVLISDIDITDDIKTEINVKQEVFDDPLGCQPLDSDELYKVSLKLEMDEDSHFEKQKVKKARKSVIRKSKKNVNLKLNIDCKMCIISFTEQENFAQHCKEVHDHNYSCDLCEFKTLKRLDLLISHRARVHSIGEDIKCEHCDYSSKVKYDMNIHIKRMHSGIFHKCDQCDYKAREKISLTRHIAAKHKNIVYYCDQCTYTAAHERTVHLHKLRIHEGLVERWPCDHCDMVLANKQTLNNHVAAKHGEKKFLCDQCDYKSAVKGELKLHVRSHHEDFMYECKECDFSCKGKTSLRKHVDKIHKGVTYPCEDCDHVASTAGKLREHRVRKHGVDSKWKCDMCGHRSSIRSELMRHIREKHEGKPYRYKPKKQVQEQKEEPAF